MQGVTNPTSTTRGVVLATPPEFWQITLKVVALMTGLAPDPTVETVGIALFPKKELQYASDHGDKIE